MTEKDKDEIAKSVALALHVATPEILACALMNACEALMVAFSKANPDSFERMKAKGELESAIGFAVVSFLKDGAEDAKKERDKRAASGTPMQEPAKPMDRITAERMTSDLLARVRQPGGGQQPQQPSA